MERGFGEEISLEQLDAYKIANEIKRHASESVNEEALKICTVEKDPVHYAMTQNNLGNAYRDLSEVRDKGENLKTAINDAKATPVNNPKN